MKIAVLGGGSWGITLSGHLVRGQHAVRLWEFDPLRVKHMAAERTDEVILPGVRLPDDVAVTGDMAEALGGAQVVLFVVPSHTLRATAKKASSHWPSGATAVVATKGLEEESLKRMDEVLEETLPPGVSVTVLSGPSHAEEVAHMQPTALVAASRDTAASGVVQGAFHHEPLRVYTSVDVVGVCLGGSLKNIIAMAAGILDGLGMGDNTKALLMTRGLHEITRLGTALGALPPTFAGLAGMGDLFVTCMSRHSRNRLLGEKIGKGLSLEAALSQMVMVAEGVKTSRAARDLSRKAGVETPIIDQVCRVLFEAVPAREALKALMSRGAKPEAEEP